MEIKRATEIYIETTRRFVIRQPETDETILCPVCGEEMMPAEMSAAFFQIKCRRVYQLVEAGAAHFVETEAGATLVCLSSLDAAIGNTNGASLAEIAGLLADSATKNSAGEIEI